MKNSNIDFNNPKRRSSVQIRKLSVISNGHAKTIFNKFVQPINNNEMMQKERQSI